MNYKDTTFWQCVPEKSPPHLLSRGQIKSLMVVGYSLSIFP